MRVVASVKANLCSDSPYTDIELNGYKDIDGVLEESASHTITKVRVHNIPYEELESFETQLWHSESMLEIITEPVLTACRIYVKKTTAN